MGWWLSAYVAADAGAAPLCVVDVDNHRVDVFLCCCLTQRAQVHGRGAARLSILDAEAS
jgi:hypothetical protein